MKVTVLSGALRHREAFEGVFERMNVNLVPEPENEHDKNAIKVVADGLGCIGYVTAGYFPAGFKGYVGEAMINTDVKEELLDKNVAFKATIFDLKSNGCAIALETEEEIVTIKEEEDMSAKWEIGTNDEEFTLVGCGRWDSGVKVGDNVVIDVENYYIRANGKIGGTASAFTADGKKIGVFPQSDRKKADVEEMGGKVVSGDEIKEARASDTLINEGYFVVDISKDGRYVKVAFGGFELVPEEEETPEAVVEEINEEKEVKIMYEIIAIATNKMNELLTLYEVETIVEPVVEEETVVEATVDVLDELDALNASIRELKAQKDAIEAEMARKMARREELAKINAKRIKLIDAIRNELETLDISVLEAMKDCMPSSYKEEGFPSPIVKKVHEGKWLNEEEWEEYVEDYWERGFDVLREQEEELNLNDSKAVKRFVNRVKRFNKKLNQFKNQGYDKILTLYWIKNYNVLRTVCKQFNLSATRLTGSCILKDDDISFFLEA